MLRVREALLAARALMTGEAAGGVFLRRGVKREDQPVRGRRRRLLALGGFFGVRMRLSRTVAALTVHPLPRFRAHDLKVRRLVKLRDLGLVAGAAPFLADESLIGGLTR